MYSEKSSVLTVLCVLGGAARHDDRLNQEEKRMASPRRLVFLCGGDIMGVFLGGLGGIWYLGRYGDRQGT